MTAPESLPSIRLLPRQLANQIAAGEVVERPASILKELLENSFDAGAGRVDIELSQSGVKRICVQDDGHGISRDELHLAVSRHATSKIATLADLENIISMGFRGEALASIASVARLQITSRSRSSDQAWRLQCGDPDADTAAPLHPAAHPLGTSVETLDLFYNTPARRKFLRSERTEYRHMEDVVKRLALSRFDVAFSLVHNQRAIYKLPAAVDGQGRARRVVRLCGKAFVEQAINLEFAASGLRLWGWAAPPEASRSQADLQYFFVNGRIIRDRLITHALRQAYGDRLFPGRHPAYVLYLELEPAQVDVNVHPTKHEVRFREGRLVHDFLSRSLSEAFRSGATAAIAPREHVLAHHKPAPGNVPGNVQEAGFSHRRNTASVQSRLAEPLSAYADSRIEARPLAAAEKLQSSLTKAPLRVLERFVLLEKEEGVLLVDMVAVRTWQIAERLGHCQEEPIVSQPVLFPLRFVPGMEVVELVQANQALFEILGFDLTVMDTELLLRRVPAVLKDVDLGAMLPEWLGALTEKAEAELNLECLLALLAQAGARHEKRHWTPEEMTRLLREFETQPPPNSAGAWTVLNGETLTQLLKGKGHG